MRAPRTERGRFALVIGLAAAVTVFTATVPLLRGWFDLKVYYGTVDAWVRHGGHVYDYQQPGTTYGFTYPPFAALIMLPMAFVGLPTSIVIALLLNLVATAAVVRILVGRELGRYGWFGWALAACALALFEPVRDTFSFGQVNLLMLALVLTDAWLLSTGRERWAGAGIGLAAAIKLTPAVFIGLLLLARRWRVAAVATAVAASATVLAALAAPDASRHYWTRAVWDTTRVGRLNYVSNQSLQGVLARLAAPGDPSRGVWVLVVVLVLAVWAWRTHRALRAGNWRSAFALTGLTACLISPITWVHHLVWLLPSFAVLVHARRLRIAVALYAVLCTSVVWLWFDDASGIDGFLGSNTYTWITLGLLLGLPVGQSRFFSRLPRSCTASASAAPVATPTSAAPASVPAPTQSEKLSSLRSVPAGSVPRPDRASRGRPDSSEPTGVTCPAASTPQSSRERASS